MSWLPSINPVTLQRLRRFRSIRRAYVSMILLVALFAITLLAEVLCNNRPLIVHHNGRLSFPVLFNYPEDRFLDNDVHTRTDYKALREHPVFANTSGNWILFPPAPYGPLEPVEPDRIHLPDAVEVTVRPTVRAAAVYVNKSLQVVRSSGLNSMFPDTAPHALQGQPLASLVALPNNLAAALSPRFANRKAEATRFRVVPRGRVEAHILLTLNAFSPRESPPPLVRINMRREVPSTMRRRSFPVKSSLRIPRAHRDFWSKLSNPQRQAATERIRARFRGPVAPLEIHVDGHKAELTFQREEVRFPFRPTRDHWLGTDSSGRDVFARVLYGLRTSLAFGVLLVISATVLGVIAGAVQGYFGGAVDITTQRLIEIWSALPFLYIMILLGSVYGRSFSLLLFVYALFNWIGISYYMRAEFLRLRKQDFVEAARCLGLPARVIIFRHILPNAIVPVLTLFPFMLVGAVGSLAALDYLGFGLPPPTPSLGELLFQAQQFRWAWWLILYPSLALFVVMLLGVFVGEGIRAAYDPKQTSRLE